MKMSQPYLLNSPNMAVSTLNSCSIISNDFSSLREHCNSNGAISVSPLLNPSLPLSIKEMMQRWLPLPEENAAFSTDCFMNFAQNSAAFDSTISALGSATVEKHKCTQCGRFFDSLIALQDHRSVHDGIKSFTCKHCGQIFTTRHGRNYHQMIHTGENPFQCVICLKNFRSRDSLKRHEKLHNAKLKKMKKTTTFSNANDVMSAFLAPNSSFASQPGFLCDICGKSFSTRHGRNYHKRIHSGETPFRCLVCQKSFRGRDSLRRHEKLHTGDQSSQCALSKAGRASSSDDRNADFRYYPCNICNKVFSTRHGCKYHQLIHSGEKPFVCQFCAMEFRWATALRRHVLSVHCSRQDRASKLFSCKFCNRLYVTSRGCKYHEQGHLNEKNFALN